MDLVVINSQEDVSVCRLCRLAPDTCVSRAFCKKPDTRGYTRSTEKVKPTHPEAPRAEAGVDRLPWTRCRFRNDAWAAHLWTRIEHVAREHSDYTWSDIATLVTNSNLAENTDREKTYWLCLQIMHAAVRNGVARRSGRYDKATQTDARKFYV